MMSSRQKRLPRSESSGGSSGLDLQEARAPRPSTSPDAAQARQRPRPGCTSSALCGDRHTPAGSRCPPCRPADAASLGQRGEATARSSARCRVARPGRRPRPAGPVRSDESVGGTGHATRHAHDEVSSGPARRRAGRRCRAAGAARRRGRGRRARTPDDLAVLRLGVELRHERPRVEEDVVAEVVCPWCSGVRFGVEYLEAVVSASCTEPLCSATAGRQAAVSAGRDASGAGISSVGRCSASRMCRWTIAAPAASQRMPILHELVDRRGRQRPGSVRLGGLRAGGRHGDQGGRRGVSARTWTSSCQRGAGPRLHRSVTQPSDQLRYLSNY